MPTIRTALKRDLPQVVELWQRASPFDEPKPERLTAFFDNREYYEPEGVLLAEEGTAVAAFALSIGNQGDAGWVPLFLIDPEATPSDVADLLLGEIEGFLRAKGVRHVTVGPFGYALRFSPGIDTRYSDILSVLSRNRYNVTDASQVDIVKDLRGFEIPPRIRDAMAALKKEGITFAFCDSVFRAAYRDFMTQHFSWWYDDETDDAESREDPKRRVLALRGGEVVAFTAFSEDRDWYIWATGVRPDLRWKRIGSVLVFLALEEIKRRGASRMCISDCPIEFYKVVEGEVVRRYISMGKPLKDN